MKCRISGLDKKKVRIKDISLFIWGMNVGLIIAGFAAFLQSLPK